MTNEKEHIFIAPMKSACADCGRTDIEHKAMNRCDNCYHRFYNKTKRASGDKSLKGAKTPMNTPLDSIT